MDWIPLAAAGLGAISAWGLARTWRRVRLRRRFAVARAAEHDAIRMAKRAGFRVLGEQVRGQLELWVDGESTTVEVRADMLLEKRGRRYIAEVKSGQAAPEPSHRATRRQLYEYALAFGHERILLFDMARGRIREVRFDKPGANARPQWTSALAGLLIGAGSMWWWLGL